MSIKAMRVKVYTFYIYKFEYIIKLKYNKIYKFCYKFEYLITKSILVSVSFAIVIIASTVSTGAGESCGVQMLILVDSISSSIG